MPLSPTETRRLLEQIGQHPRKSLGQNFLVDGNIVAKSVELARVGEGDAVVEVGPGLGTLTGALLAAGAEVWAVELDLKLHAYLRSTLAAEHPERLHLLQGDAVEYPLAGFPGGRPVKVVANLPYAVSTPWFEGLFAHELPVRLVLMLQKEAADRYLAQPGTKAFGAISVFVQAAVDRQPGHRVSRGCFHPMPEVDSVLLHLVRKDAPHVFAPGTRARIRRLFQQRRKQLGSLCRGDPILEGWLARLGSELGIPPGTRPEAVPIEGWLLLG
jgi:16S rRNA (adenine1518-N6/adenine1519-N6)-dimethyltransferase